MPDKESTAARLAGQSGDELVHTYEDAISQIQGLLPDLTRTVDELDRYAAAKRLAAKPRTEHPDTSQAGDASARKVPDGADSGPTRGRP